VNERHVPAFVSAEGSVGEAPATRGRAKGCTRHGCRAKSPDRPKAMPGPPPERLCQGPSGKAKAERWAMAVPDQRRRSAAQRRHDQDASSAISPISSSSLSRAPADMHTYITLAARHHLLSRPLPPHDRTPPACLCLAIELRLRSCRMRPTARYWTARPRLSRAIPSPSTCPSQPRKGI